MWWLIEGNQSRWTYPGGATGGIDALEAMESRLTGFNDECVVRALGSTSIGGSWLAAIVCAVISIELSRRAEMPLVRGSSGSNPARGAGNGVEFVVRGGAKGVEGGSHNPFHAVRAASGVAPGGGWSAPEEMPSAGPGELIVADISACQGGMGRAPDIRHCL